jgi:hypothetical protein
VDGSCLTPRFLDGGARLRHHWRIFRILSPYTFKVRKTPFQRFEQVRRCRYQIGASYGIRIFLFR